MSGCYATKENIPLKLVLKAFSLTRQFLWELSYKGRSLQSWREIGSWDIFILKWLLSRCYICSFTAIYCISQVIVTQSVSKVPLLHSWVVSDTIVLLPKKKKCNQVTAILYALNVFAVILARLKCYQMHLTEKIPKQYRKVFTACTFAPNHFRLWKLTDCLKSGQVCAELSFKENVNRRFISNTHKEYSWGEKAQSDSNHTCHQPWRVFLW